MRLLAVRKGYAAPEHLRRIATTHGYLNRVAEVCCKICESASYDLYAPGADSPDLPACIEWFDCKLASECGEHLDFIETPDLRTTANSLAA